MWKYIAAYVIMEVIKQDKFADILIYLTVGWLLTVDGVHSTTTNK